MKDGVGLFIVCKWNLNSSSVETECKSPPLEPILSHICKFQSSVLSKVQKLIRTLSYITAVFGGVLLSQHPSTEHSGMSLIQKSCIYFLFSPTKMKVQCTVWLTRAALYFIKKSYSSYYCACTTLHFINTFIHTLKRLQFILFLQRHKTEFKPYNILQTLHLSFKNTDSWEIKLFEVYKHTAN